MFNIFKIKYFIVLTAIIVFSLYLLSCSTKVNVHHLDGQKIDSEGVEYSLPLNVVQLKLTISKITQKPGKLWFCADELNRLGFSAESIKSIKGTNKKIYQMPDNKSVSLKISNPVFLIQSPPDPDQTYLVEVKGGLFKQQDLTIKLNKMGNITSFDVTVTDKTSEFISTFVETAATLAPPVFLSPTPPGYVTPPVPQCTRSLRNDSIVVINEILDLRKEKKNLIVGKNSSIMTKETLDSMIAEINKLEKSTLDKNFRGSSSKVEWKPDFEYIPRSNGEEVLLFSITDKNCIKLPTPNPGVKTASNLDEIQVSGKINKNCASQMIAVEDIKLFITVPSNYQENIRIQKIKASQDLSVPKVDQGIVYRIPARAKVEVTSKKRLPFAKPKFIGRSKPQIAQLGIIASLPPELGTGKTGYALEFNDDTGSLKKMGSSSGTTDPAFISKTGTSAKSIIDTIEGREIEKLKLKNEKTQQEINEIKLDDELDTLKSQD